MPTDNTLTILHVSGPFREPREPVFSYDYSLQRPMWPMPHAARVKISITDELDIIRGKLLGTVNGTPGQQLLIGQLLSRRIADEKLKIADREGLLSDRRDVIVAPFTGAHAHLFPKLEEWAGREQERLRAEVKTRTGL
ncbi:hypothetical protein W02_34660 [Nitrospira sp. KM1]|uniref:hypothetical protein n=1 Tax=Nitrospira sp. KM1 TaxID=1936990 RepID=UPI0013A7B510|nr:hypothetical protein [Nitrospira sp. KM1]BCA56326.1 hypothetical protein W02_34660 [Nitrospira sp. KM1]